MFQHIKIELHLVAHLSNMFEELGEPAQVLDATSPHPLVIHYVVSQMSLVIAGSGYASLAGREISIATGDLLLLAPGCAHAFRTSGGDLVLRHWHWPQDRLADDRFILSNQHEFGSLPAHAKGDHD